MQHKVDATGFEFFVASEIVVTGYNPELADWDNPRGACHAAVYYVVAQDARGNRLAHGHLTRDAAAADRLCWKISAAAQIDLRYWTPTRPAYGSEAYEQHGEAADVARERAAA